MYSLNIHSFYRCYFHHAMQHTALFDIKKGYLYQLNYLKLFKLTETNDWNSEYYSIYNIAIYSLGDASEMHSALRNIIA